MVYDDGDFHHENLTYRTYRLPDLSGDKVFNPEADAESLPMTNLGAGSGTKKKKEKDTSPSVPQAIGKPNGAMKSGTALIGQRIQVWWAKDEEYYTGIIKSYKKVH